MEEQPQPVLNNVKEYQGDLLQADVEVIAHQCNCMSKNVSGLARAIFEANPAANTYMVENPDPWQFGTFRTFAGNDYTKALILNLYAQLYPGTASDNDAGGVTDTAANRLVAFRQAFSMFLAAYNGQIKSVGLPKFIGCGLAGGNWDDYYAIIIDLARQNPDIEFHIVEKV